MDQRKQFFSTAAGIVLCLGVAACTNRANSELTVEGSYGGTTETQCQLALREVGGSEELVDAVSVGPDFHQVFKVEPEKKQYFVQVSCADGKWGRSPAFYFEPPRSGMQLQQIQVN